jgi:hypothetical protein
MERVLGGYVSVEGMMFYYCLQPLFLFSCMLNSVTAL